MEYKACDFFVSRIPLLPVESYFDVFDNGNDDEVKEKLFSLFKSGNLEEALDSVYLSWERIAAQIAIQRMCTAAIKASEVLA